MPEITGETPADPRSAGVLEALERILRPLVRLLISRAIPYPVAAAVLRRVYVDVAVEEFPVEGKAQTDSRITLLTGVHRKDVKRLRTEARAARRPPKAASLGPQLVARWLTSPEYAEPDGTPKPLPRAHAPASFESLVRSLSTDIRPRVVLDEWLRLGLVHVDADDRVHLDVAAFVPASGSEEMTWFFGRNLHDHVAAAVHNMLGGGAPFLERSVNYNNLTPAAVAELTTAAHDRGVELLRELNARALRLQQRDAGHADAALRWNAGVYVFAEDEAASPAPAARAERDA